MILTHFSKEPLKVRKEKTLVKINSANDMGCYTKPTGLWLSDETSEMGWSSWYKAEDFRLGSLQNKTDFEVDMTDVLHLKGESDIDTFTDSYFEGDSYRGRVDWETVSKKYKGILITPYVWSRRMTNWYYTWDCASGCFWDTSCLERVKDV